jgi:hypothetical protein
MITNISDIRRRNLVALKLTSSQLATQCGGQPKSWANVLSTVGRAFGEKKARHIEQCLGLKLGALDEQMPGVEFRTLAAVHKHAQRVRPLEVSRNSAGGILSEGQFRAISSLLEYREPQISGAFMVLVQGWRIVDAAMAVGGNSTVLGGMVRRMQHAHLQIMKAYLTEDGA